IISRIQVEPDLARGLAVRLQEKIDQQSIHCFIIRGNPLVRASEKINYPKSGADYGPRMF
ncbi:hypothetical protein, partial [Thiolapillus sp.]|uniref:hypothetical protein n=1 Tax=Thiolapillus sp. TaxID=2017437 RepID=UPI003AF4AF27